MWEVVSIVAATVVIVWLLDLMDLSEIFIAKLKGRAPRKELEERLSAVERKVNAMASASGSASGSGDATGSSQTRESAEQDT